MKALSKLVLFVLLCVLSVPSTLAASSTLSDEELLEYFPSGSSVWWDYLSTVSYSGSFDSSELSIVEDEEDATTRRQGLDCSIFQCFAWGENGWQFEYYVENGAVYLNKVNNVSTDLKMIDLDGFSGDFIETYRGYFLGYDSMQGLDSDYSCELNFDEEALVNMCVYNIENIEVDSEVRIIITETYEKGLGLVEVEEEHYEKGEWEVTYTRTLTDTNIEFEDTAQEEEDEVEDDDVELSSDDELLDQNISDYLEFDDDTWWEYELTTTDYLSGTESTAREVVRENDETGLDGYVEDNVYYITTFDGEPLQEDYIAVDLEGYSETIQPEDYDVFSVDESVWGEVDDMILSCEYEFDDSDSTLLENCELTFNLASGVEMRMLIESHYVKNFGTSLQMLRFYAGNTLLLQIEMELLDSSLTAEEIFPDVSASNTNFAAIHYLYDEGIVAGYDDGTFKPKNTVNRAELLKILVEGQGLTPDADQYKNCFPDVTTDWYAKYVCYAKEEGWVSGYPDGTFKPADTVNKVEALKMLLNSQDIDTETPTEEPYEDVSVDAWFARYVATAQTLGLLEETDDSFSPDSDRTRAGIAEELYRLLTRG
jgi:hypothetical protein